MKFKLSIIIFLFLFLFPLNVFAADSTFSIRPTSGNVVKGKNFTVDILIDTNGDKSALGRAVLKFNPEQLTVVRAERNSSLYCIYPEDQQSIDNQGGLLMVTGFCQSGVGFPYVTTGEPDVFARVTFKTLTTGNSLISWEYTGEDIPFNSAIVKDGSPPTVLLKTKPKSATFKIVSSSTTPSTPSNPTSPTTPNTGLNLSIGLVSGGIILLVLGFVYGKVVDKKRLKTAGTVVTYE